MQDNYALVQYWHHSETLLTEHEEVPAQVWVAGGPAESLRVQGQSGSEPGQGSSSHLDTARAEAQAAVKCGREQAQSMRTQAEHYSAAMVIRGDARSTTARSLQLMVERDLQQNPPHNYLNGTLVTLRIPQKKSSCRSE
jgi:hypothetical protein